MQRNCGIVWADLKAQALYDYHNESHLYLSFLTFIDHIYNWHIYVNAGQMNWKQDKTNLVLVPVLDSNTLAARTKYWDQGPISLTFNDSH